MTCKVTIKNDDNDDKVCRVRHHRRNIMGDVMLDVSPHQIIGSGREVTFHLVTSSDGHRDMIVVEEGSAEMRYLSDNK